MNFFNTLSDSQRRLFVRFAAVLGALNAVLFLFILNPETTVNDFTNEDIVLKIFLGIFVLFVCYMCALYSVCVLLTSTLYERIIILFLTVAVGVAAAGTYYPVSYTVSGTMLAVMGLFYAGRNERNTNFATIDDVMRNRDGEWINMASVVRYNIQFGLKRDEVTSLLGKPSSCKTIQTGGDDSLDCWEYESHQIELVFDSDNEHRLSSISFFSKKAEVKDVAIVGLTEKELLKKFPDLHLLDEKEEPGYNYGFPGENIQIYISEGTVECFCIYD